MTENVLISDAQTSGQHETQRSRSTASLLEAKSKTLIQLARVIERAEVGVKS